jgi:predicted aspartyl protease
VRGFAVLVGLLGLASCAAGGGDPCTMNAAIDLPVMSAGHAFLTDILIDGQTVHVQIDTGSFENLLTDKAAARLKMHTQMLFGAYAEGIGGTRDMNLAASHTVQLAGAKAAHVGFLTVADATLPPSMDGLLGMPFMAPYDDDLDLVNGHLRLIESHGNCSNATPPFVGDVYSVPLERMGESNTPIVTVVINGVSFRAAIDTGAESSLMYRSAAERLGLTTAEALAHTKDHLSGVGPRQPRASFGRLHVPLEIGPLSITNMPLAIDDEPRHDGPDILLGYDFVTHVHVWISHSTHAVLMEYPPHPTPVAH